MTRACSAAIVSKLSPLVAILAFLLAITALLVTPARAEDQPAPAISQDQLVTAEAVARTCQTLGIPNCGASCCGSSCGNTCGGNCGGGGQLFCPPGYSSYDSFCLPDCPPGLQRYPGYPGVCLPPCRQGCPDGYEPVPLPQCPPGYHRDLADPNACLSDPVPPRACPEGMNFSIMSHQCEPSCPQGTYLADDRLCHNYYEKECLQGYQRDPQTGACIPNGDWPQGTQFICLPLCPDGWVRDIYQPTRCLPPRNDCGKGFEIVHGQCLPECEDGSKRNAYGYCVPQTCADGTYPDLRGNCLPVGCPAGYDSIGGNCYPPCDQGFRRNPNNPGQCDPVQHGCPDGTALNPLTGACDKVPPPPVTCRQGMVWSPRDQKCVPQRQLPDCPNGFTRTPSGSCVQGVPMLPKQPVCKQTERYNPNTGACEPIFRQPRGCPDGFIWNNRSKNCVPNPNLQQTPGLNLNPGVLKVPKFERVCPPGTTPVGSRCVTLPTGDQQQQPVIKLNRLPNLKLRNCPPGQAPDGNGNCIAIPQ